MAVITEGNLSFIFNAGSIASKYDEWSFYRNQFQQVCGGAKAVDIICVENNNIWLIEVKDYRRPDPKKVVDLHKALAQKVRDTLAGLVAAQCNANNPIEKEFAQRSLSASRIHLVFHIEQPVKVSRLFPRAVDPADLKLKLKGQLKAIDAHPKVVDQHSLRAHMPWRVAG
jgi:hypothetical protein